MTNDSSSYSSFPSSFSLILKCTRPRITSSSAMRVGLCFCGSISIRGCAPRCSCLLRFAARIIKRYFESTSCPPLPSISPSPNSVVVATRLLLLLSIMIELLSHEFFDHFPNQLFLSHATHSLGVNDRRKFAHCFLDLVVDDYVIER